MTDLAAEQYADEVMRRVRPVGAARMLLLLIVVCVVSMIVWASIATLDQVTRGQGKVIPSGELQVVQNLEGGIVREILVGEGDRVTRGQVLLKLDRTEFAGDYNRLRKRYYDAQARIARLVGESRLEDPSFAAETRHNAPEVVGREETLFAARFGGLKADLAVLEARLLQRRQALAEAELVARNADKAVAIAQREFTMVDDIVRRGLEPEMHRIDAEKALAAAESERDVAVLSLRRHRTALTETELQITSTRRAFQARASEELAEAKREYEEIVEAIPAHADRLNRTEITAPVDGVVNQVLVSTLGGVAQPGQPLVEIVPADDRMLVEIAIDPSQIGFVYVGQKGRVKLTAYDFTTFGSLEGVVTHVSADAIEDERGVSRYLAHVRATGAALTDEDGKVLPVLPGMVAEVDILTGKRSILEYMLQPLAAVQAKAFREQ